MQGERTYVFKDGATDERVSIENGYPGFPIPLQFSGRIDIRITGDSEETSALRMQDGKPDRTNLLMQVREDRLYLRLPSDFTGEVTIQVSGSCVGERQSGSFGHFGGCGGGHSSMVNPTGRTIH